MKLRTKIICMVLAGAAFLGWSYYMKGDGESNARAKQIYSLDVNEDGLDDLVVKSKHDNFLGNIDISTAFIASRDSEGMIHYTPLSDFEKKAKDSAQANYNREKKTLDATLKTMWQRVNTHKYGD